jgi:hypothetical protein
MEVNALWNEIPPGQPLPISLACGSSIHISRRKVFAVQTKSMLDLLA